MCCRLPGPLDWTQTPFPTTFFHGQSGSAKTASRAWRSLGVMVRTQLFVESVVDMTCLSSVCFYQMCVCTRCVCTRCVFVPDVCVYQMCVCPRCVFVNRAFLPDVCLLGVHHQRASNSVCEQQQVVTWQRPACITALTHRPRWLGVPC